MKCGEDLWDAEWKNALLKLSAVNCCLTTSAGSLKKERRREALLELCEDKRKKASAENLFPEQGCVKSGALFCGGDGVLDWRLGEGGLSTEGDELVSSALTDGVSN